MSDSNTTSDQPSPHGGPNYAALRAAGIHLRQSAPIRAGPPAEPPSDSDATPADATADSPSPPASGPNYQALRNAGIQIRQSANPRLRGASMSGLPPLELPILTHLKGKRVILASASPRRRALLAQVGLANLEIAPSTKPEDLSKTDYGPFEYAAATARQKCLDVYESALAAQEAASSSTEKPPPAVPEDPEVVIAADTVIVTRAGQVVEKPRSAADHGRMLRHLRDTAVHRVLTAVCVLAPKRDASHPGYEIASLTEETKVYFAEDVSDEVIDAYVKTREGADKAGGYAVQGMGGLLLVEKVDGSVDNVVGLPVRKCLGLIEKVCLRQGEAEESEGSEDET